MSGNFLSQVVDKPTRVNNILDLVLTNRPQYVADIESTKTRLSDYNFVYNTPKGHKPKPVEDGTFFGLYLFKADMDSIVRELDSVDWEALKNTCPEDDSGAVFAELIRLKTLEVCTLYTPKKWETKKTKKQAKSLKQVHSH